MSIFRTLTLALPLVSVSASVLAKEAPLAGDPVHGEKLFEKHCKSRYKKTGLGLFTSDELNLLTDQELYDRVSKGSCVTEEQKAKFDGSKLSFLEVWDMVGFMRSLVVGLDELFPEASRYYAKVYTIDKHGQKRIKEAHKALKKNERSASVYAFFEFPGEEGNLTAVPDDPQQVAKLERDKKLGYAVFLPMDGAGFSGEVAVAMDADGVIRKLMVHPDAKGADAIIPLLPRFEGMGKKGQLSPFEVSGGKKLRELADALFPVYIRAMETVTMFDREENERSWAD